MECCGKRMVKLTKFKPTINENKLMIRNLVLQAQKDTVGFNYKEKSYLCTDCGRIVQGVDRESIKSILEIESNPEYDEVQQVKVASYT